MKAVRIHEYGDADVLRLEELPTPTPGPGEALVSVHVSGVNFIDIRQRTGDKPASSFPVTLGWEGAGQVEAVGPEADGIGVDDRVAWHWRLGSYATHIVMPVEELVPLPESVSLEVAAAVMLQGLTAHTLADSAYAIKPGETCLVHAAAGGVGGLLTQMAKARGARVIGTVSRQDKVDEARKVGADDVIVYADEDLATAAQQLTDDRGVDVVYDGVGKDTFDGGLDALRPGGYMVLYGQASGPVPPIDTHVLQEGGGRYLTRAAFLQHIADRGSLLKRSSEIFEWIDSGQLTVRIAGTYPLGQAHLAHQAIASRTVAGKLLLSAT